MNKKLIILLFVFLSVFAFTDCGKIERFDAIPAISFKSFEFSDAKDQLDNTVLKGVLTFKLVDGDGNVGSDIESDVNLYIKVFKIEDGKQEEINLLIPHNYRIPDLTPEGQNKTLKADVEINIEYTAPEKLFPYDSVQYQFYVVDREKNQSNIISTPRLSTKFRGIVEAPSK